LRKTLIAVTALALIATGFAASAQTPLDDIVAQIEALNAQLDKSNSDPAILEQLEDLYAQYSAYYRTVQGVPANDSCANAIPISCGDTIAFSTLGATTDGNFSCGLGGAEIWYSITGNGGNITIDTCAGADYDTALNASTGTCGGLTEVTCNDDTCGLQSQIDIASVGGTGYLIGVGGFNGATGTGTLTVTCEVPVQLQGFDVD